MIACTLLQAATGKARQVPVLMWVISGAFVVCFTIQELLAGESARRP